MDNLEKLQIILEYEFELSRKRMRDYERAYEQIVVDLKDVKDDFNIYEFIYQLKKNVAYNAMRTIDNTHYEVKEHIKKRKLNVDEGFKECSHPQGMCKCKLPLEVVPSVQAN